MSLLQKTIKIARTPARYIDMVTKPRWPRFTGQPVTYALIVVAIFVSLATPLMELVPLSANIAGAIFVLFGLSLVAHDGLLAFIGLSVSVLLGGTLVFFLI